MKKENIDYVDLILIFKYKGKYSANIYANDGTNGKYHMVVKYFFNSKEDWKNEVFDFSMYDYDIMDKLKLEYLSHKDLEFKAKNRETLSFKFKSDSQFSLFV